MRALAVGLFLVACASPPPPRPAAEPAPTPAPEAPPVATAAEPVATSEPEPRAPPPEPEPVEPLAEPAAPADPPPSVPAPPPPAAPLPAVPANARDPRTYARRPRARALLVAELQALERLHAATPKSSPDRPLLMRRLAEGYVELGHAAAKEADGAKIVKAARKNAVKYYLAVKDDYPTYARLDEVLYYAGYERERGGELAQARALYKELVKRFPSSPFRARIPAKVLGR